MLHHLEVNLSSIVDSKIYKFIVNVFYFSVDRTVCMCVCVLNVILMICFFFFVFPIYHICGRCRPPHMPHDIPIL